MGKVTVTVQLLPRARRVTGRKALIRRVRGLKQLNLALDEVKKDIVAQVTNPPESYERLLMGISRYLGERAAQRFEQSIAPDGSTWPPLRMSKRKPLMRSKRLYGAMKDPKGQAGGFFRMSPLSVEQGTTLYYAEWQQKGFNHPIYPVKAKVLSWLGTSGRVFAAKTMGIPARPFSGVNAADGVAIAKMTAKFYKTGKVK